MAGRRILPNCDDITAFENETCCTTAAQVVDIDDAVDEEIGVGTGRIPSSECAAVSLRSYMSTFVSPCSTQPRTWGFREERAEAVEKRREKKRKSCPAPASVANHKRCSKNAHGISVRQSDQLNRRVLGSRTDRAHNLVILGIPAGGGDVGMPPSPEPEVAKVAHREEAAWRGSAHEQARKAKPLSMG